MASITELLVAELLPGTRRTPERVPEGQNDWKPHDKSTQLGHLAGLVAVMPGWIGPVPSLYRPSADEQYPGG